MATPSTLNKEEIKHLVIVGGGFGGLYAAKALGKTSNLQITLIDKRNFHLFQPLLYQVATGGLSPGDIASPLRGVLRKHKNITVVQGEVLDIDAEARTLRLHDSELTYDVLIIATGVSHHYFGKEAEWAALAPGLKTVENALDIRRRILLAFEAAEREAAPDKRRAWLNFVVVGAGPTGVELAGALGELANATLEGNFRHINPAEAQIYLLEGVDRVLPPYPPKLSHKATQALHKLGVTVQTESIVTDITDHSVTVKRVDGTSETIPTRTVLWAAGMKASPLGAKVAQAAGAETDRAGRVKVNPDLSVGQYDNIFVIGDLAYVEQDGQPLPGVAQVAMQQGKYVADRLKKINQAAPPKPFRYQNRGNMAVIGRNSAVVEAPFAQFSGFPAWLLWVFIHIAYLIEFGNRLVVLLQWAMSYITRKRGARLITGEAPYPVVDSQVRPEA